MGLDQWLYRSDYSIDTSDIVFKECITWRKNYAINDWILNTIQETPFDVNCKYLFIDANDLKQLLHLIDKELDARGTKKAMSWLPDETVFEDEDYKDEYLEWYYEDLERTKDILEPILEEHPDDDYYYYIWF